MSASVIASTLISEYIAEAEDARNRPEDVEGAAGDGEAGGFCFEEDGEEIECDAGGSVGERGGSDASPDAPFGFG